MTRPLITLLILIWTASLQAQRMDYDSLYYYQNCIILDAKESTDQERDDLLYHWEFGDGTQATGQIIEHCYDSLGKYEIVLSIVDTTASSLFTDEWNFEMLIEEDYWLSFGFNKMNNEVSFLSQLRSKEEPEHVQYFWDFGNGNFDVGDEAFQVFDTSGEFEVRLLAVVVNGDDQIELSSTKTIQIIEK